MKKTIIFFLIFFTVATINAQKKFDEKTGKNILNLLPAKMKDNGIKKENDRVKDAKGFLGVIIHRDYGNDKQKVRVEIINNSPSLISVNNFLNDPVDNPAKYKIITIGGYKGLIQTLYGENSKVNYELLLPMSATLLSVKTYNYTRDDLIVLANTIPVAKISKMVAK